MNENNTNYKKNIHSTFIDTFPIIPLIHMTYAEIIPSHHKVDMYLHYENHKKVHYEK